MTFLNDVSQTENVTSNVEELNENIARLIRQDENKDLLINNYRDVIQEHHDAFDRVVKFVINEFKDDSDKLQEVIEELDLPVACAPNDIDVTLTISFTIPWRYFGDADELANNVLDDVVYTIGCYNDNGDPSFEATVIDSDYVIHNPLEFL